MKWSGGSSRHCSREPVRLPSVLTAAVFCLLAASSPAPAQRLVLLPMENQGDSPEAVTWIAPRIETEVRARGWDVISGSPVEDRLSASRIRRMDSLPSGAREALLGELDAQGYLATTIFSFRFSEVPVVTVGIRLVDASGSDLFSEVIGLSTEDTRGPLDSLPGGEIEPLVDRVIELLFRGFPAAGETARQGEPDASPVKLHEPFTFLSAHLDAIDPPRRVAILPFRSFAREREAARIAAQLTAHWLERVPGFEPIEPADLRNALIAERVRDASLIWPETMVALGRRLDSTLFLRGTVYRWQPEAVTGSEVRTPEVEMNLTLIDAATSRIVWSSQHGRRGDQYSGFMRLGAITNVVALADRVIGEMVAAQHAATPVSVPPPRSPLAPANGSLESPPDGQERGID